MHLSDYDPFATECLRDPYPFYRALRDESPVHHVESRRLWVVTRHDDVVAVARNHGVFSSTGGVGPDWEPRAMMPMYDPPEHTRLRRLVSKPFQPNAVAERGALIARRVAELVDHALEAGRVDVVNDIAIPMSLGLIADLLGVEEPRRPDLRRWSFGVIDDLGGGLTPRDKARVEASRKEFAAFLHQLVAARRARQDPAANDLISLLMIAQEDDKLTEKELLGFCVLLLVAGFETTVNAVANGALAFAENPAEWEKLRADPSLVKTAVEEMVRYDGPVQSFFRNTLVDTEVAGVAIPKGEKVMVTFASANRDERKYDAPDAFRIDRRSPDHVAYGAGIHYCLGAPLARLQLSTLWSALATRTKGFEIDGEVERSANVLFRGARTLPVRIFAA